MDACARVGESCEDVDLAHLAGVFTDEEAGVLHALRFIEGGALIIIVGAYGTGRHEEEARRPEAGPRVARPKQEHLYMCDHRAAATAYVHTSAYVYAGAAYVAPAAVAGRGRSRPRASAAVHVCRAVRAHVRIRPHTSARRSHTSAAWSSRVHARLDARAGARGRPDPRRRRRGRTRGKRENAPSVNGKHRQWTTGRSRGVLGVHSRAVSSCLPRSVRLICAISGTSGSSGFGSVSLKADRQHVTLLIIGAPATTGPSGCPDKSRRSR